ncbi:MAG: hypothetical protein RL268_512 [Pseudomonadota bacterium]|jgi:hypothetical protein
MATKQYQMPAGNQSALSRLADQQNWEFWHYQTYAAAGQGSLTFFTAAPGSLSLEDYNFKAAGAFPAGMWFVLQEYMVDFTPGAAVPPSAFGAQTAARFANDVYAAGRGGALEFVYGNKTFCQVAPLARAPMDGGLNGFAAAADQTTAAAASQTVLSYAQWRGRPQRVADMLIEPQVNLEWKMSWPNGAIALPSTVAGRIGVRMKGVLGRLVQ